MINKEKIRQVLLSEVSVFFYIWLLLWLLPLFVSGEGDGGMPIDWHHTVITANLVLLTALNNFILLPKYLTRGRYLYYFVFVIVAIVLFSLLGEAVLEPFLFPHFKYSQFSMEGLRFAIIRNFFTVALFSSYKLLWNYQQKQNEISQLEKEKVESELKFLKSQINPHVLFNNLNNIYSYALEQSEKVPDMILKLSDIMRYMLYEAGETYVPLDKEIDYLRDFIELQKLRMEDRGDIRFNVEGNVDNQYIAPLLLIAFVENSFKHSMASSSQHICIKFEIIVDQSTLYFRAENPLDGHSSRTRESKKMKTEGIGLHNVQKRLEFLYPDRHKLNIRKEDSRFIVDLELKLENNGNKKSDNRR